MHWCVNDETFTNTNHISIVYAYAECGHAA